MGFNSAFKGLMCLYVRARLYLLKNFKLMDFH